MLTVHVCLEHPNAGWGGIGSALGLLIAAQRSAGQNVRLLHPVTNVAEIPGGICLAQGEDWPNPGTVYSAENRISLGEELSRRSARFIDEWKSAEMVRLIVHNEEFLHLIHRFVDDPRVDVLYISHGLATQEHAASEALIVLQAQVLTSGARIAAVSEAQRRLVESLNPSRNVDLIPLPLELLINHSRPGQQQGALAAGRWVSQKGFDALLRAWPSVGTTETLAVYAGHGDADFERECRALAKATARVRIHDWLSKAEFMRRVCRTRLVIVPSRFEPLGLVAAEALGCGVPVLGTNTGGLGDLLSSMHQPTVPLRAVELDVEELASAIAHALKEPPRVDPEGLRVWSVRRTLAAMEGDRHGS
jgi:glycosyltransferase involved in cell wall biosynthesis